jgi:hypothetical protein
VKEIITAVAVAGSIYLLLLLFKPLHRCFKCGGRKVVPYGNRKGVRPCKRCKATGKTRWPGSVTVQRLVHEHFWPWLRDRIHDAIAKRTEGSTQDQP